MGEAKVNVAMEEESRVRGSLKVVSDSDIVPKGSAAPKKPGAAKIHMVLTLMQFGFAGHQILSKVALTTGMSQFVYAMYRNGIALFIISPFAYLLEKKERPQLTGALLFKFFILGFLALVGSQQLFLTGLIYTSAPFAAAMQNSVSVITFLMAWILGLEKVRFDRRDGRAKALGTVVCVVGAVMMSIYKGPAVIQGWADETESAGPMDEAEAKAMFGHMLGTQAVNIGITKWQIGGILLLINCVSWAGYLIMQAPILKVCPTPLTITSFTYFFGSIQVGILTFALHGGKLNWSLSWGSQVFSVLYAGVISSGINLSLQAWAIQKGGPLLVSLYTPCQTILVAIIAVVFLGDSLYLGSVVGGLGAVVGLYVVTWGQVEHRKRDALEAGMHSNRDLEAAAPSPRLPISQSVSSLTQPLLADGDFQSGEQDQVAEVSHGNRQLRSNPPIIWQPSFYHDELSASFSPHHVH